MRSFLIFLLAFTACSHVSTISETADARETDVNAPPPIRLGPVPPVVPAARPLEVYFSPNGGCTDHIVQFIDSATTSVRMQAYSFTSPPIIAALVRAANAKKSVIVILDKNETKAVPGGFHALLDAHIEVLIDSKHAIAHNKVIIIDDTAVETGSFNFTVQAEKRNAENCMFVYEKAVAQKYQVQWDVHRNHSVPGTL